MGYMPGARGIMYVSGAPSAGVDEVQNAVFAGAPAGNFSLLINGYATAPIPHSTVNATLVQNIQTAIDATPGLGAGNIVASVGTTPPLVAGVGSVLLTFSGANVAKRAHATIGVLTQPSPGTLTITESTAGVDRHPANPRVGALLVNEANGDLMRNTGTPTAPVWTAVT